MDSGQGEGRSMKGEVMLKDKWKDSALVKEDGWTENEFRNREMVGVDGKGRWMEG